MLAADHSFFSLGVAHAIKERSRDHVCGVRGSHTPTALGGVYHIAIYLYISRSPPLSTYIQRAQERGREREGATQTEKENYACVYTRAHTDVHAHLMRASTVAACLHDYIMPPSTCYDEASASDLANSCERLCLRGVAWEGGTHMCKLTNCPHS